MAGLLARPSPSVRVNVGVLAATLLPLELYLGEFGTQPIATSNTSRIGAIATILLFPVFVSMPHVSSNSDRNLSARISPQVRRKSCRSDPENACQSAFRRPLHYGSDDQNFCSTDAPFAGSWSIHQWLRPASSAMPAPARSPAALAPSTERKGSSVGSRTRPVAG